MQPDPKRWTVLAPRLGTRDALEIRVPDQLDHALLERMIEIESTPGGPIDGDIEILDHETRWRFTPPTQILAAPCCEPTVLDQASGRHPPATAEQQAGGQQRYAVRP